MDGEEIQIIEMEFQRFNLCQTLCYQMINVWRSVPMNILLNFFTCSGLQVIFKWSVRWLWFFNFKSTLYSFLLQIFWVTWMISDKNTHSLDVNTLLKYGLLHRNHLILKNASRNAKYLVIFFSCSIVKYFKGLS